MYFPFPIDFQGLPYLVKLKDPTKLSAEGSPRSWNDMKMIWSKNNFPAPKFFLPVDSWLSLHPTATKTGIFVYVGRIFFF